MNLFVSVNKFPEMTTLASFDFTAAKIVTSSGASANDH